MSSAGSPIERHDHPPLRRADLDPDPFEQFRLWFEEAERVVPLPDAMTLATVDLDGNPDARMVLLKGHGPDGFRFFTNRESVKAEQLEASGAAALVVYWRELDRQVRVRGAVRQVPPEESDAYFASRPRDAQIGAWASPQSQPVASREELERMVHEIEVRFEGVDVPRPSHWGGYVLQPESFEFWQGRHSRLHDRFRYSRGDNGWRIERLAP